jgi:hypothetical protein
MHHGTVVWFNGPMADDRLIQIVATLCFALAVVHTFLVKKFQKASHRYPEGSVGENLLHLLGEIEVVFGIWAGVFLLFFMIAGGVERSLGYLESRNFTEPVFVFVIMAVCSSRPILMVGEKIISLAGRLIPVRKALGFYIATLVVGPLLGSFITEPAAMTVTALILLKNFYRPEMSDKLKYATLGLLFVNISVGGTLTPYAAPPVLMVAGQWNWDIGFMLSHFGYKAFIAVALSTMAVAIRFRKEIESLGAMTKTRDAGLRIPGWVSLLHLLVLVGVVVSAHHIILFVGLFLFFLGVASVTQEYQSELKIKEALLVAFFLGGLVVLGGYQAWWLEPILRTLTAQSLYLGAMFLTAFTDNAAITYLGGQVAGLSELSKYALVAGSVVGGGLTVIANAPNPAGFSTLNPTFGPDGISPIGLFKSACAPTLIAALCFWFL